MVQNELYHAKRTMLLKLTFSHQLINFMRIIIFYAPLKLSSVVNSLVNCQCFVFTYETMVMRG